MKLYDYHTAPSLLWVFAPFNSTKFTPVSADKVYTSHYKDSELSELKLKEKFVDRSSVHQYHYLRSY